MIISRSLLIWSALAACGLLVIGAMTWLTRDVLMAEEERAAAEARADLEERTRLALWRMDAAGAAILAAENRRSSASPAEEEDLVKLRFGMSESGGFRSAGDAAAVAEMRRLLAANPLPDGEWSMLCEAAEAGETAWNAVPKEAVQLRADNRGLLESVGGGQARQQQVYQLNRNATELAQRAKAIEDAVAEVPEAGQREPARPVWIGGELFLLRQVAAGARERAVEGVWLDYRLLARRLLAEADDLLPAAELLPALGGREAAADPLGLVSFPFRLLRNEERLAAGHVIGRPLAIGWVAVAAALVTASLLVHGVMRLSERRASFVSAVTHELRTPLTTFRLYSEMLEGGVVREDKRGEYLRVLSREADRLSHLVENVLAFSRIERGSARSAVGEDTVADLLEPMRERFESRLAAAGLALEMDLAAPAAGFGCKVDVAAVEHILFNLVDNAAKHAAGSLPPVVRIRVREVAGGVAIEVVDHGPGIPASERRRIFRPFHKSARDAAESRPGVGLGLALSRRLARSIGGRLEHLPAENGARFVLRLRAFSPD